MIHRTSIVIVPLLAALLGTAAAQEVKPVPPPPKQGPEGPQPAPAQDPEPIKPRELTPTERVERLKEEIARLRQEIAYVTGSRGTFATGIAKRLGAQARPLDLRTIEAGSAPAAFTAPQIGEPIKAQVLDDAQSSDLAADVVMLVNGRPVTQSEVDLLVKYLQSFPTSGTDELRMQRAYSELIRTKAIHASFGEGAAVAETRVKKYLAGLEKGDMSFDQIAKDATGIVTPILSDTESAGDAAVAPTMTITRNSHFGIETERTAFATGEGEVSEMFWTPQGCCLLRVEKVARGEQPDQDRVDIRLVAVPYGEPTEVHSVMSRVATGQVQILLRDEATRAFLPPQYR